MNPQDQAQLDTWAKFARIRQQSRDMGSKDGEWTRMLSMPALIALVIAVWCLFLKLVVMP